jgi:HlyD family secretion protein
MTANVTIYTRELDSALLIPVKAIRFRPDSSEMKKYKIEPLSQTHDQQYNERNKDSTTAASYERAYVWLQQGDKIVQRKIKTGLNNSINVQVLAGLTPSDLVLTGISGHEPGKASANGASPFMPTRRTAGRGGPGR